MNIPEGHASALYGTTYEFADCRTCGDAIERPNSNVKWKHARATNCPKSEPMAAAGSFVAGALCRWCGYDVIRYGAEHKVWYHAGDVIECAMVDRARTARPTPHRRDRDDTSTTKRTAEARTSWSPDEW